MGDTARKKKRDMQVDRDERGSGITGDDYEERSGNGSRRLGGRQSGRRKRDTKCCILKEIEIKRSDIWP